jgi:hypothetical protein
LSLPALFSPHIIFIILSVSAFLASLPFTMNINPGMVTLLASKNLGDLSKNTPAVKELLMAILKAVENVGAHKITGGKQCVSICCCPFISPFIVAYFSFYIFFYLFSHYGLRLRICCSSRGQHVNNKNGRRKFITSKTTWCRQ